MMMSALHSLEQHWTQENKTKANKKEKEKKRR
jgi:hypothetical protein